jgi:uncharacterized protein
LGEQARVASHGARHRREPSVAIAGGGIICGVRLLWIASAAFVLVACASGEPADPGQGAQLVAAAGRGDGGEVRRLLDAGVAVDARDGRGRTAVTAAAMGRHAPVVRLLVDAGADVDVQDRERNNALLACGETGSVQVLRQVLRAKPDLGSTNRYGGTALIPAADRGHVGVVRELLGTNIDVDHVNRLGWTALLEAVILGDGGPAHQRVVALLIAADADPAIPDRDGVTALEHARRRGYTEIARILDRA